MCGGKGGPARLELTCELESADNDVTDGVRVGTGYWREGEVVVQFEGILNNPYSGHQSLRRNTHTHTHTQSTVTAALYTSSECHTHCSKRHLHVVLVSEPGAVHQGSIQWYLLKANPPVKMAEQLYTCIYMYIVNCPRAVLLSGHSHA